MSIDINDLRDMLGNLCVQSLQQQSRARNAEALLLEKTKECDELRAARGEPVQPLDLASLELAVSPDEIEAKLAKLKRGPKLPAMPGESAPAN